nr:hypothetical protein Iba_chr10eCG3550 [Ipomoea batatas]
MPLILTAASFEILPKNTLIAVSAHVSPPPPGFGLVGLQNADCKAGKGSFPFKGFRAKRRSFTGDVKEFRSTNTLRYSVQSLLGDLMSPF